MAISTKVDNNIEALRGYCALVVVLFHCIFFCNKLDNGINLNPTVISFAPSGHAMVMVFFMLSGYVIGLTSSSGRTFSIRDYLKRRLVRLYPIYLLAILATIILFKETLPSIIGTLFFGQNLFIKVLSHNRPLWSLNYEVLFYVLAIPIIKFDINPKYILGFLFFMLIVVLKIHAPAIAVAYIIGFIFWITGYTVSKVKLAETSGVRPFSADLISLFFLLLTADLLNGCSLIWEKIIKKLSITFVQPRFTFDGSVNIHDFGIYLLCLYAICVAASIKTNWLKMLSLIVFLSGWGALLYFVFDGSFSRTPLLYLPGFYLLLSTIFYFIKKPAFSFTSLWVNLGSISYALYVIHFPILFAIGSVSFFSGSLLAYLTRIVFLIVMAVTMSYLLEKKLQPIIKQYFFRKKIPLASK